MNKSSKIIVGVVVVALVVWGIASGSRTKPDSSANEKPVIKIGVVAPITGGGAIFGQAISKGIALAEQDATSTKNTYQVIIEDDGTNPVQSASAAHKLIDVDGVKALITMSSGTGNAVAPIAEASKIVAICVCSDTKVGFGKYNYTNLVMPDDEAEAYVDEAVSKGIKSISLMSQNHPGVNALMTALRPALAAKGIKILTDEKFDGTNRDFKTIVTKAKAAKADTNFISAYPPSLDILGKNLKDAGVTPISGEATFAISADLSVFEGAWTTDGSASAAFTDRFTKAFPSVRFNPRSAPYGYDTFQMLVRGFESGTSDIAAYIGSITSFDGVAGHVVRDGNNFRSPAGLYTVTNGKVVLLK